MNHLLLDSHILLWLVEPDAGHLTAKTRQMISGAANVYFSIVSLWEIAIKAAKGHSISTSTCCSKPLTQPGSESFQSSESIFKRCAGCLSITATRLIACWWRRRSLSRCIC
jgi:hypothetical protein